MLCQLQSTPFQKSQRSSPGYVSPTFLQSLKSVWLWIVPTEVALLKFMYLRLSGLSAEKAGQSGRALKTSWQFRGTSAPEHFGFWHITKDAQVQLIPSDMSFH